MAKLDAKLIKVFAGNSGDNGTTVFGTAKDGNTQFSKDPDVLQNNNYMQGWKAAKLLNSTPLLEDFNTVFYNITRELLYLAQTGGFREWIDDTNSGTDALYNKGSVIGAIENNVPVLYYSLTDNNQGNNPTTDGGTNWKKLYYTRDELTEILASGVVYKHEVETIADLPTEGNKIGDEYLVKDDGSGNSIFAIWDGTTWDYTQNDLSKIIDGSALTLSNLSAEAINVLKNLIGDNVRDIFDMKYTNDTIIPLGWCPLNGTLIDIASVPTLYQALKSDRYRFKRFIKSYKYCK
jgi:hypothetical protein